MRISVVIRTYNEQRYLGELLAGTRAQALDGHELEIVVVDSGSTDRTLAIAQEHGVRVVPIRKEDFSFGRSLNVGCAAATGDALVFVSGHCIPAGSRWLADLVAPLGRDGIAYTYGGQRGDATSRFSETQIFRKYFPASASRLPQQGFYCNNANAALLRPVWAEHRFDEELTGLEDMHLAKRLVERGLKIGYVAEAAVYHLHNETWTQVRRRFEREAIALQDIMPEVQLGRRDVLRYFVHAVVLDMADAVRQRCWRRQALGIVAYRFQQFTGAYRGNHLRRRLSREIKESYFYPR
jgi:glycosyltransferase involved in cell wall biosynthesis